MTKHHPSLRMVAVIDSLASLQHVPHVNFLPTLTIGDSRVSLPVLASNGQMDLPSGIDHLNLIVAVLRSVMAADKLHWDLPPAVLRLIADGHPSTSRLSWSPRILQMWIELRPSSTDTTNSWL